MCVCVLSMLIMFLKILRKKSINAQWILPPYDDLT